MAGWKRSRQVKRPKRLCNASHPFTQPGTVTVWMPCDGALLRPCSLRNSIESPWGANPLELIPVRLPVFRSQTSRKQTPAEPVHHRLDDTHHRIGGYSGVDGRAAAGQDLRSGL